MNSILTRVADSLGGFTPSKPREYLALQIARKLNDASAVRHYAILFEHHPEEFLVAVTAAAPVKGGLQANSS